MANKAIQLTDSADSLFPICAVTQNSNSGRYAKFADGTLIQWGYTDVSIPTANAQVDKTITFAIEFIDVNYGIVVNALSNVNVDIQARVRSLNKGDCICSVKRSNTTTTYIGWIAIGRWK